jgi:hypothetical protein
MAQHGTDIDGRADAEAPVRGLPWGAGSCLHRLIDPIPAIEAGDRN